MTDPLTLTARRRRFNNAGINGPGNSSVLTSTPEAWQQVFAVNLFGAVNIIQAFAPHMMATALPSGAKSRLVTTSSVVGLLNHTAGPYTTSKFAVTAMVEQFYLELTEQHPEAAEHIGVHMLHPTAAGTGFFENKGADGQAQVPEEVKDDNDAVISKLAAHSMDAAGIVDGLLQGMADGRFYCVVDAAQDTPTASQIALRMEDQMSGAAPRRPKQLGMMSVVAEERARVKAALAGVVAPVTAR